MSRFAVRCLFTLFIAIGWPILCLCAALYVTGLLVNAVVQEWAE